jgi:hypothetical protein
MNKNEKQLLKHFRDLNDENKNALMRFAEFLSQQVDTQAVLIEEPAVIEPKAGETVVGALKRLSASYFMLDKATMLNETSSIMAQHIMQGREKAEVIEELEVLFKTTYEKLKRDNNSL